MTIQKKEIQIENLEDCIRIHNLQYAGKSQTVEWGKRIITAREEADRRIVVPDFPLYAAAWNALYRAEKNQPQDVTEVLYFVLEHLPENYPNVHWHDGPGRRVITSTYFKVDSVHPLRSRRERAYKVKGHFIHSVCKQKIPTTLEVKDSYERVAWDNDLSGALTGMNWGALNTLKKTELQLDFSDLKDSLVGLISNPGRIYTIGL